MLRRSEELLQDGYALIRTAEVALPHQVWRVDLEIEEDQQLGLSEETVLRLIRSGVATSNGLAELMGVEPDVAVERTVVRMLQRGFLTHRDGLQITKQGERALVDQLIRVPRRCTDVEMRYDPYEDVFRWNFDAFHLKDARGVHALPAVGELTALDVEIRQAEIEDMIRRWGLPFEKERQKGERERPRDLVRLTARHSYAEWRQAELEVWYRERDEQWEWCLIYQKGESPKISAKLRKLHEDGVEIIPLERTPAPIALRPEVVTLVAELERVRPQSRVLQTNDHRPALKAAIDAVRSELIIISPWLTSDAVDDELLGWLELALKRNKNCMVHIGYGIESDPGGKQTQKAQDHNRAMGRLKTLAARYRGRLRLTELGNTHEKLVICDGRHAINTSFNWLSFNPRPGRAVRRETGIIIDNIQDVQALRAALCAPLELVP